MPNYASLKIVAQEVVLFSPFLFNIVTNDFLSDLLFADDRSFGRSFGNFKFCH